VDFAIGFPSLYPILDAAFLPSRAEARQSVLRSWVGELAEAGVSLLQYRNKQGSEPEILADAAAIRLAAGSGMRLILNDWPRLAVQAGFDGVHVGQQDVSPREARAIVGPHRIVGVSTHNESQLRKAEGEPVDYIAIGPVFSTSSKENPDPVLGLEGVRLARGITRKPLVAIGGITLESAVEVRTAGADTVAVISAIFRRDADSEGSPGKLAKDFLRIFE